MTMLALMTVLLAAAPQAQDFSWSGELTGDQRLVVANVFGEVRVELASGRRVEVTAVKRAGRYGNPEDVEITAEETSRGVRICVRYPGTRPDRVRDRDRNLDDGCRSVGNGGNDRRNRNDTEVNFVVRLPAGVRIEAGTVSGNVVARGLGADAKVTTVSGSVSVDGFTGGRLDATSVSGNVNLRNIRGTRVDAETVSGNVDFAGSLASNGSYEFTTLSGTVRVELPVGTGADLRASTFSGRIRFPEGTVDETGNRRRSRASGRLGQGGASLTAESFSGNVEVRVGR